ncbi:uncharacterized protein LOC132043480 [Lycium ferocissimum]|uniref:uncharacterized protein LOC132043480 n=1 Tax=Lycium ferocissimum TaxID=112874 RepID=UPI0028168418|nr:uncharacterized protein LOC132043480 [Lycium ferocissimum]
MKKTSENEFLYLFVALYAFIKRFECCRPIVVVDGSHIKTAYNGTFVSANTMDGAGNILPLAYGVIDSENDKSWTWFLNEFKEAYGLRESMCVVSIGMNPSRLYPKYILMFPVLHAYGIFGRMYTINIERVTRSLSGVYYAMIKAYTRDEFDMLMEKVATVDIRVKDYLELAEGKSGLGFMLQINRAWTMRSNIAESINSALVQARELPIFDFLEEVRIMFGHWNFTNRQNGSYTFTTLGKRFNEMLSINESKSARMTVTLCVSVCVFNFFGIFHDTQNLVWLYSTYADCIYSYV